MSGIEILGVVASIVQIADLGGRLSVKLCTFCHKFKHANKALRYLSKDVALTCNVLRQLGDSLGQDDLACLYSPDAFETAQDVLRECEQVFQDLESAIEQHYPDPNSQSRIDKMARKFKFLMNEPHLDAVAGNLERLKSTMLLMLNVVIYAGQIRSRREAHEIQEQRNLLLVLSSEKIESERNYERLTRTLQFTSITETTGNMENPIGVDQPDETKDELYHYCHMVKSVLNDINTVQNLLDSERYRRVRNGFIGLHRLEASMFQRTHGGRALDIFRAQIPDSFRSVTSGNPAQTITQMTLNQQSPINQSQALNQANATSSSSEPLDVHTLNLEQIRERMMQVAREFQSSRQAQQASGQHDPVHQQRQLQTMRLLQARAMFLQRLQMQSQEASRPVGLAPQTPPVPNLQSNRMQLQRPSTPQQQIQTQLMQNRSAPAPAPAQMAQLQAHIQQQQMQAQAMQNRSAPAMAQMAQMEALIQQRQMATSVNPNDLNLQSNQSHGLHWPAPLNSFKPSRSDPMSQYAPPQYTPTIRSQSQVPAYNMAPQAQASPPKPPFPLTQSTEGNVEKSFTGLSTLDASAFSLDFSASDETDALESFDFDTFLNEDEDHTEQSKSHQVGSEAAPSHYGKKDPQPDQPTTHDSDDSIPRNKSRKRTANATFSDQSTPHDSDGSNQKRNMRKRKVNATFSEDDNLKTQTNPDTTPEEGQSRRIQLGSSTSVNKSSSAVSVPPPVSAETQTQTPPSAATTNDPSSTSKDTPIETLDAWILRWTKLEQAELK